MQKITADNILYQLITKMNLDFVMRDFKSSTRFSATDYTVVAHKNNNGDYYLFVGINVHQTPSVNTNIFDIDKFVEHYHDGLQHRIDELQQQIQRFRDKMDEQKCQRIPKDISHIIGYNYHTLKLIGGAELVYVDKAYSDKEFILGDIAKTLPLLERYIKENEIISSTKIKLLTPDTFKKEYPIKPYKE